MDIADSFPSQNESLPVDILNQAFSYTADILGNLSFILLIAYLYRIRNEDNNDPHALLFRQLWLLAGVILLFRNISRLILWFVVYPNHKMENTLQTARILFFVVFNIFIACFNNLPVTAVITFSFTAAVQRLILTYKREYAYLMKGTPMYVIIAVNWSVAFLHIFLLKRTTWSFLSFSTFNGTVEVIILDGVLVTMASISSYIYYHFYRLISTFTDQYEYHRIHLLYQFVPIHTVLMVFSAVQLITRSMGYLDVDEETLRYVLLNLEKIMTPLIPTVISLSYILSRENIRSLLLAVLGPIWVEISG